MVLSTHTQQHCSALPKKPYTLAGFELESSVPQADAMTTAPGHASILPLQPVTHFFCNPRKASVAGLPDFSWYDMPEWENISK
jgi:hypothetical protein